MPVDEDDMIMSTQDYFVTENKLNPKASAAEIEALVRKHKTTGLVTTTTLNTGGVQGILVTERKKLDDKEANDVRRVLGMDYEVEIAEEEE